MDCRSSQAHSANKPPATNSSSETGSGLFCPDSGSVKVPTGVVSGGKSPVGVANCVPLGVGV